MLLSAEAAGVRQPRAIETSCEILSGGWSAADLSPSCQNHNCQNESHGDACGEEADHQKQSQLQLSNLPETEDQVRQGEARYISSLCVLTHVFHRFTQSAVTASRPRTNAFTARTIVPDLSPTTPAQKKPDTRPSARRPTTIREKARLIIHLHLPMAREARSPRLHLLPAVP